MNLKLILTVLFVGVASAVRPLPHDGNLHVFFFEHFFISFDSFLSVIHIFNQLGLATL